MNDLYNFQDISLLCKIIENRFLNYANCMVLTQEDAIQQVL